MLSLIRLARDDHPFVEAIQLLDQRALDWVAATEHGPLRSVFTATARAADALVPWLGYTAWAATHDDPDRRVAVVRGWAGMGLAAVVGNVIVKPLVDRGRPDAEALPAEQRRPVKPSTSAFPSGHIGGATAFAVAAGPSAAGPRAVLWTLALATSYARVFTGRHFLSDGVVGVAVGLAAGAVARYLPLERVVTPSASRNPVTSEATRPGSE